MSSNTEIDEIFKSSEDKTAEEVASENNKLKEALSASKRESKMDPDVLAKLAAKSEKKEDKQEEEVPKVIDTKAVSINIGVIGVGQAGSRIAEEFHKRGYDAGVINTSSQDLEFINMLPGQKLLLEGSLGGTGKDLDLGRDIFDASSQEIDTFSDKVLEGNDMAFLAISGGGGTGSSSVDVMVNILFNTGMPLGVIFVLPKATEDAKSKRNAIETLSRLARMAADDMISSLVVVDNARIEAIYSGLSQSKFWETANSAIVEPIHLFNSLTAQASRHTSLDPSDFGKVISAGDCSVYGVIEVEDYMEETALAEAVIESLSGNMLADGFDLSQTRVGGVIITGSEEAIANLPAINLDYAFHIVSEKTNGASIYQGIYTDESVDGIKIYSWFAGLGLPVDRIENLKRESKEQAAVMAAKEKTRGASMTLDLEEDKTTSVTEKIHNKISKKKSGFNKLQGTKKSIIDRRRK